MSWHTSRGYCLARAMRLLAEHPGRTVVAVVVASLALAMPLTTVMVAQALPVGSVLQPVAEINVFAAPGTGASELKALSAKIGALDGVAGVKVLARDQAWADLQRRAPGTQALPEGRLNALPDVVIAEFAPGTAPAVVEASAAAAGKLPRVESVQADLQWYRRVATAARTLSQAATPLAGVLALLVLAIVVGAVRLTAVLERDELRVLQSIGADQDFMRRPSVYAGGAVLGLAAALALGLTAAVRAAAEPTVAELGRAFGLESTLRLPPAPLVLAFAAGAVLIGGVAALYFAGRALGRAGP